MKKTIDPNIAYWAQLIKEEKEPVDESVDKQEILDTAFSTLLRFMNGDSDKILKDSEWMMYLINDIQTAMSQKIFRAQADDTKIFEQIKKNHFGSDDE